MQLTDNFIHNAERIEIAMILPPYYAVQFLEGKKYLTGSDYSEEYLNKTIFEHYLENMVNDH